MSAARHATTAISRIKRRATTPQRDLVVRREHHPRRGLVTQPVQGVQMELRRVQERLRSGMVRGEGAGLKALQRMTAKLLLEQERGESQELESQQQHTSRK